ncbi:MAG: hypothetical protein R3B69_02645 [Candidatus Paceibacterota bacterium]
MPSTPSCANHNYKDALSLDEVKQIIKNSTRPRKTLAVSDVVDKIGTIF